MIKTEGSQHPVLTQRRDLCTPDNDLQSPEKKEHVQEEASDVDLSHVESEHHVDDAEQVEQEIRGTSLENPQFDQKIHGDDQEIHPNYTGNPEFDPAFWTSDNDPFLEEQELEPEPVKPRNLLKTPINKRLLLGGSPACTPLPDYEQMLTPALRAELRRFGLKVYC